MAKTFLQMVSEATASVPEVAPKEASRRLQDDPRTLLIDVRDEDRRRATGQIPGAVAISTGSLLFKADQEVPDEWRDPRLQDRSRPIIVHCDLGPLSAISAKTLQDMGFAEVSYLAGGIDAWAKDGLPVEPAGARQS